jgi:hypothetical protein
MRFSRTERYEPLSWTDRKKKLAASRPARDLAKARAALPLLADQLEAALPVDLDAEAQRRQALLDAAERRMREMTARHWRCARRQYFAASPAQQEAIRAAWAAWQGPSTAGNFQYLVDVATGVMEQRSARMRARDAELRRSIAEQEARQGVLSIGGVL